MRRMRVWKQRKIADGDDRVQPVRQTWEIQLEDEQVCWSNRMGTTRFSLMKGREVLNISFCKRSSSKQT
eukprot:766651-Hanusia_phi.AAC.2